jgi:hypothetical protein
VTVDIDPDLEHRLVDVMFAECLEFVTLGRDFVDEEGFHEDVKLDERPLLPLQSAISADMNPSRCKSKAHIGWKKIPVAARQSATVKL